MEMLGRVARYFHTDPGSMLEWSPFRLGLAIIAFEQCTAGDWRDATKAKAFPVFNVRS